MFRFVSRIVSVLLSKQPVVKAATRVRHQRSRIRARVDRLRQHGPLACKYAKSTLGDTASTGKPIK